MLEKSVRLKERTRCEVGSAEGHLVRKTKERINWSLFPTGGRNSIWSTKCASFVKTRSSREGFCTLNLVGCVTCWVQLSSEDRASSLQPKFWSVDAILDQSIRGALKSPTIRKCVIYGSLTTSRRKSSRAMSSLTSDEGERYTTTRRRRSVTSRENFRLRASIVAGRIG